MESNIDKVWIEEMAGQDNGPNRSVRRAHRKYNPRVPRKGEHFVFHDDMKFVYEVDHVTAGVVYYRDMANERDFTRSISSFNEFFTRVPI